MDVFLFLEDFDDEFLQGNEWEEQMREAVEQYNQDYDKNYPVYETIQKYKRWKKNKQKGDR